MPDLLAENRFSTRRRLVGSGLALAGVTSFPALGRAASSTPLETITYLLPAPKDAVTLAPFTLADSLGFYAARGLKVRFQVVPGGAKVGEALARGEGDLGGASGDTPILLRARGVPVKGVAVLGGHAFLTLMTDRRRKLSPTRLSGAVLGVPSLNDVSFYALEAQIKALGLGPGAVTVQAAPPAELWKRLGEGDLDGMVGTVDWGVRAERAGVRLDYVNLDRFFPAMAQAVLASDAEIAQHPERVRGFVGATLQAVALIRRSPERAATAYLTATPTTDLSLAEVAETFRLLGRYVYGGQRIAGRHDAATAMALQTRYLQRGLIEVARPDTDLFSDRFT